MNRSTKFLARRRIERKLQILEMLKNKGVSDIVLDKAYDDLMREINTYESYSLNTNDYYFLAKIYEEVNNIY